MFTEIVLLTISAIFVNDVARLHVFDLPSLTAKSAIHIIGMTAVTLALTSVANWIIYFVLLKSFHLEFLRTVIFITAIMTIAQFISLIAKKIYPMPDRTSQFFAPLMAINPAVLGTALLISSIANNTIEAFKIIFLATFIFVTISTLFSAMQERLNTADIPAPFKGTAINMISGGLIALAFMGFAGLV